MSSRARGRSPARKGTTPTTIKSATTPKRSATAEKSRRSYAAGTSAETLDGKSIDQKEMAGLGDTEARLTRKLKNTPEHLYGVDKEDVAASDDVVIVKDKPVAKYESELLKEGVVRNLKSVGKIMGLVAIILITMKAFLHLKERDFKFDNFHHGTDSTQRVGSNDELQQKLSMIFEMISESGKLFKEMERQTKQKFDDIDVKLTEFTYNNGKEMEDIKEDMESLKRNTIQKDHLDFAKYTEKDVPFENSEVHSLVEMALLQYDADKIGIPDYALESAGGRIHVPYHSDSHSSGSPIMKVFGIVVWRETRTPREIIKPEVQPGNCWPLKGSSGYVVIKLALPIIPSMVTMEHLPPSLAKYSEEIWESTPKNFTVFGWLDEYGKEKVGLGSFVYVQGNKARQTFPVQVILEHPIEYVQLQIDSNHGNKEYTCIYRFRVHGTPEQMQINEIENE